MPAERITEIYTCACRAAHGELVTTHAATAELVNSEVSRLETTIQSNAESSQVCTACYSTFFCSMHKFPGKMGLRCFQCSVENNCGFLHDGWLLY